MSNTVYWETLNTKLRNDWTEFTRPEPADNSDIMRLSKLTIENSDELKKAVQRALDNPKDIAKLEFTHNNAQAIAITENHLDRARQLIESESCTEATIDAAIDATGDVPLDDFLWHCHALASRKPSKCTIVTDDRRKALIANIFASTKFEEEISTRSQIVAQSKIACTQVIFDSADAASAIDQLIMNASDRTWSSWRIQSVYVQESLKERIHELLTAKKLNALNTMAGRGETAGKDDRENQKLAQKYGGDFVTNGTICLLFNVPAKYLANVERTLFYQIPIVINFFRTTKELIQLVRTDLDANKQQLTSIWTENIGLFYETAAEVQSDVIWSNCIGLFDPKMPLISKNFANSSAANNRFEFSVSLLLFFRKRTNKINANDFYHFSSGSSINAKGKYALHVLTGASTKSKYLYIPYGKTFAN